MSVILARFDTPLDAHTAAGEIKRNCPYFSVIGDWYEHRLAITKKALQSTIESGAKYDNPDTLIETVLNARERHGKTLHIQLELSSADVVQGSLSSKGLMLTNIAIDSSALERNERFQQFRDAVSSGSREVSFEILE